jgi:Leucine-rich repeat (LRR) protein
LTNESIALTACLSRRNKISIVAQELAFCRKLEELLLERNHLTEIPAAIERLDDLKILSLTGNMIPVPSLDLNSVRAVRDYLRAQTIRTSRSLISVELVILG